MELARSGHDGQYTRDERSALLVHYPDWVGKPFIDDYLIIHNVRFVLYLQTYGPFLENTLAYTWPIGRAPTR